jgi:restriction endonuclease
METGTGKTYCYIKTMFELHKRYGWSKFIVVVPSIAIREGVKKVFRDYRRALSGRIRQAGAGVHLQLQKPAQSRASHRTPAST